MLTLPLGRKRYSTAFGHCHGTLDQFILICVSSRLNLKPNALTRMKVAVLDFGIHTFFIAISQSIVAT